MTTIFFSRLGLEHEEAEGRDGEEREEERGEQGDDVGEGQGQEHLALDALEGDDRDEGQGDDELAEDARLADFQHGLEDGRELAAALPRPRPGGAGRFRPG